MSQPHLKPYAHYKDSGIDWLGEVPEHWEITKAKHVTKFQTGWTPPTGNAEAYEGDNLWANISDLGEKWISDTAKRISDKAVKESRLNISPKGSLLFSFKLSIGQISFANRDMYTNEAIATFLPHPKLDEHYAYYVLPFYLVQNAAENIYGAKLLNQELIRSALMLLPSRQEQTAIAEFLDRETGKIDALVAEQRRLIDLLKEKRQAVISHAVTKGLNPNAPMKDSGIEWLGQIPAHWDIYALKYVASLKSGDGITSDSIEDEGEYPVFGGNGFRGYTSNYTHEGIYALIGRQGALCGNINYARGKFWASEHAVVVSKLKDVETFWLGEILRIMNLGQYSVSAAQPGLSVEIINKLKVPVPPKIEQTNIANFIHNETDKLDELITQSERAIELLQERRTALISAAVTGKIDVRQPVQELIPA